MDRKHIVGVAALSLAIAVMAVAQGFKVYPGAKKYTPPETEESKDPRRPRRGQCRRFT